MIRKPWNVNTFMYCAYPSSRQAGAFSATPWHRPSSTCVACQPAWDKVYHYGNHGSQADCLEQAEILKAAEMDTIYSAGLDISEAANGNYAKQGQRGQQGLHAARRKPVASQNTPDDFLLGVRYPHPEVTRHHAGVIYLHHSAGLMEPGSRRRFVQANTYANSRRAFHSRRPGQFQMIPGTTVLPHIIFSDKRACHREPKRWARITSSSSISSSCVVMVASAWPSSGRMMFSSARARRSVRRYSRSSR